MRAESVARRHLRWALVAVAGGAVAAYGGVVPGGWVPMLGFALAAALSWSTIRRMPTPPPAAEGTVGIGLALGLAEELWRTGSLVLAAGTLLAIVQGLLAPRAAARMHRWAVTGGVAGHLLATTLWPMSTFAGTVFLTGLGLLGLVGAWTLALAHRVVVASEWGDGTAVAAASRLESDGAGRGSWWGATWLTVAALALAAVTFVLIPRPVRDGGARQGGSGLLGPTGPRSTPHDRPPRSPNENQTGFRDRVDFDDIGPIKLDARVAMRVRCFDVQGNAETPTTPKNPDGSRADLLLRGVALNHYAGGSWSASGVATRVYRDRDDGQDDGKTAVARPPANANVWHLQVEPFTAAAPYAFHVGQLLAAGFEEIIYDGNGTAALAAPMEDPYEVWSIAVPPSAARLEAASVTPSAPFVQIPWRNPRTLETLDEVRESLAGTERNPYRLARTLERALRQRREYTLAVDKPSGDGDPLAAFLLGKAPGHCEYFASTMVLLLRRAGVPCRLVAGFRTKEVDPNYRAYVVRHRDAHAWVEVRFDGIGWVAFDPTPADSAAQGPVQVEPAPLPDLPPPPDVLEDFDPSFVDRVMTFDADERASVLEHTGGLWGLILVVGVVGIVGLVGLRSWQRWAGTDRDGYTGDARDQAARRWRRSPPGFYATLTRILAAAGFHRGPAGTPRELARSVRRGRGPAPRTVGRITRAFERFRYREEPLTPEHESELRDWVDQVARNPDAD